MSGRNYITRDRQQARVFLHEHNIQRVSTILLNATSLSYRRRVWFLIVSVLLFSRDTKVRTRYKLFRLRVRVPVFETDRPVVQGSLWAIRPSFFFTPLVYLPSVIPWLARVVWSLGRF